jgi:AraC family transcriptional regulator
VIKQKTAHQSHFHRSQIGRAQRFIRLHLAESLSMDQLAREAGSSSFHFARLFQAYVGETPFAYIRRLRLATALNMLREDSGASVTEIAQCIGYDTSAAFNKSLRKAIDLTPGEFRKAGKEHQDTMVYALSQPRKPKEANVNLASEFEAVSRPATHYTFLEVRGPFPEVAPPLWNDLMPILQRIDPQSIREYLGLSGMDSSKAGEDAMIYQAGVSLTEKPAQLPATMRYRHVPGGKYARFLLTGPFTQIWPAFDQAFKLLAAAKTSLRPEFCVENYLNDPRTTPEAELKTELLIPIA